MTHPRRIGIDLDGVLIDHREHKRKLAAEYGIVLEPWQANANLIRSFVPDECHRPLQHDLYGQLTVDAPPVQGALEHLPELRAEIFIVSARRIESIRHAQDWLVRHRVYDVVSADRIFFCGVDEEKRGYCNRLGLDLFLDDKLAVLEALPARTKRVLFDEDGAAARINAEDRFNVVRSWRDFRTFVNGTAVGPAFPDKSRVAVSEVKKTAP